MIVVTPTLKAAEVAAAETGAEGHSASWLIHQHGWRWDDDGHWTRQPDPTPPRPRGCGPVICCSSTRPACSTKTSPARS